MRAANTLVRADVDGLVRVRMQTSMWGMYRTRRRSREGVVSGCAATVEDSGCRRGPVGVGAGLSHLSQAGAFWRDPGPRLIGFPSIAAVEVVLHSICSGRGTLQLQIQEILCRATTTPAAAGRAEGCRGHRTCGLRTRWRAPMSMAWFRCKVQTSMWGMYGTRRRLREGVVSGSGVGAPRPVPLDTGFRRYDGEGCGGSPWRGCLSRRPSGFLPSQE